MTLYSQIARTNTKPTYGLILISLVNKALYLIYVPISK